MSAILLKIAAIGIAGIGSQWAAWRFRIPAIALLLITGLILGPVTGYLNPTVDFGALYKPIIAFSVAIILFEGGLTLNFSEIKETSRGLKQIIILGGPMVWLFSTIAGHYAAGLEWPTAAILGAIFVITGPTVIMPLLRQARLSHRPASLLRWEAIVNDPIGALFAVIAFEVFLVIQGEHTASSVVMTIMIGAIVAVVGGIATGRLLIAAFVRGMVPEFLKAPLLLVCVLAIYAISDLVLEESGLLTVTILGITLANSRIASLTEMRRFKETITILLVSGLFILLTASFDVSALQSLGWNGVIFVLLILFVARPVAIGLATIGSQLTWRERLLVAWIAPRGIVAVAVSGLFGAALTDLGVADGSKMTALAFAVVASTIFLHGFTLSPLASLLGLKSGERPGVLIVGCNDWTTALAKKLMEIEVPVLISDANWNHIRRARLANVPVHFGEVLSEAAHHTISFNRFSHMIAATDNDSYNSLVCTEFGPEIGRSTVFQIGAARDEADRNALNFTLGGRPLFRPGIAHSTLQSQIWLEWVFHSTTLTEEFTLNDYRDQRSDEVSIILWVKPNGTILFQEGKHQNQPEPGDTILAFGLPLKGKSSAPNNLRTGETSA